MTPTIPDRLYKAQFAQQVHRNFQLMREHAPVFKAKFTRYKPAYLVTRYDNVLALLSDDRLIKNPRSAKSATGKSTDIWLPRSFRPLLHNMLNSDEPDHRRLRNLVHQAFTPRIIEQLQPRIEGLTQRLLDNLESQFSDGQSVDLVQAFALPLPMTVIAELIGIPPAGRKKIIRMTDRLMATMNPLTGMLAVPAITGFMKYIRQLAAQRRADPQDDLLTALVQAEHEGDQFSEDELLGMVFLLTVAGHETTVGLISNAVVALFQYPDQWALLAKQPTLIDSAVEEFLRYDGPLATTELAFAKQDFTLHGIDIPQGAIVLPAILSANRDPAAFDRPDALDITRSPNRHLAFGHGIHYCLGAPLARIKTAIAINGLIERFPKLSLACSAESIRYKSMFITHRPTELPVRAAPGRGS